MPGTGWKRRWQPLNDDVVDGLTSPIAFIAAGSRRFGGGASHFGPPQGAPIRGLPAAGGAAAGFSGANANGYQPGNGLIQAFATGLIVTETMDATSMRAAALRT
jgi:hypothetical protein